MKLAAYSIRDDKAEVFNTPFFMSTNGQALRAFQDLANDPNSTINKHPEDYRLYHVATFDDHSGLFHLDDAGPTYLATASDLVKLNAVPIASLRKATP